MPYECVSILCLILTVMSLLLGQNCDEDVIECKEDSCKNGGTCNEVAGGDFACQCVQGEWQKTRFTHHTASLTLSQSTIFSVTV